MKKNLRIVSAAAAALLAVAPVAAAAVSVNAAANTEVSIGNTLTPLPNNSDVKISSSLTGVVTMNGTTPVAGTFHVGGSVSASLSGSNFSAILPANAKLNATANNGTTQGQPGHYTVAYPANTSMNFGSANANKTITISLPEGISATVSSNNYADGDSTAANYTTDGTKSKDIKVKIDKDGLLTFTNLSVTNVKVVNSSDATAVLFYNKQNGQSVTSGNITVYAGNDAKMNVSQIVTEFNKNFQAGQLNSSATTGEFAVSANDVAKQLRAQGIDVDDNGYFTAPKSFTLNMTATSNSTNATATMALTVNVPNGKDTTVPSQSKTIMHNAYFYDKDAKRVGTDKLTRYNSVTVAMSTTTIHGKAYYEVVENNKATGKFINADNIDGTKRTLKHNAYVYRSSKKRANKLVLKKGEEVTTYGGTYTFKNGKQYYKIGNDTKKTYVKASNF